MALICALLPFVLASCASRGSELSDPLPGSAVSSPDASVATQASEPAPSPTPETVSSPQSPSPAALTEFSGTIDEIDPARLTHSWRPGCPVGPNDLRILTVSHWGFDGKIKSGELVVHRKQADNVIAVMRKLFDQRFPIEKIELIDKYQGDDDLSVAANNSSAFNCRSVIGRPGVWSQHSYGWAIDINPVQNPFINSGKLTPPAGESYRDRSQKLPGMIHANDDVVKEFRSIGWKWGGYWNNPKDYQHFSLTGR
jgi:D-alanyl-D-alanine carboxypeptidase-like protein